MREKVVTYVWIESVFDKDIKIWRERGREGERPGHILIVMRDDETENRVKLLKIPSYWHLIFWKILL